MAPRLRFREGHEPIVTHTTLRGCLTSCCRSPNTSVKPRAREVLGCQRPGAGPAANLLFGKMLFASKARTGGPASIGLWPWELGEALAPRQTVANGRRILPRPGAQVPEPLGTGRRAIGLLAGSWHPGKDSYANARSGAKLLHHSNRLFQDISRPTD